MWYVNEFEMISEHAVGFAVDTPGRGRGAALGPVHCLAPVWFTCVACLAQLTERLKAILWSRWKRDTWNILLRRSTFNSKQESCCLCASHADEMSDITTIQERLLNGMKKSHNCFLKANMALLTELSFKQSRC